MRIFSATFLAVLVTLLSTATSVVSENPPHIDQVQVNVLKSDGQTQVLSETLPKSHQIGTAITVRHGEIFSVVVKIKDHKDRKPLNPQQVVLTVQNKHAVADLLSVLCSKSAEGEYTCTVKTDDLRTQRALTTGTHAVALHIAGHKVIPTTQDLGNVRFEIAEPPVPQSAKTTAGGASLDEIFAAQPELHHTFRAPDKMPNKVLSLTFSLLVLAPWLLLLGSYIVLGANVKNVFSNSVLFLSGTTFMAALSVCVLLYYIYWVRLNLFQLLGYGSALGTVTAIVGRQALVARAALRQASRVVKVKKVE
ncbi:Dolichyl-diphosphooligosaccharide--protein glycosyltransferase subunit Swp1 [Phlyctochytrium arcticum]|nr:Dolichyl-diphosphooligosaccharide--protein glycosyltransferase subunit Swp1 [Phlyctochytrium arcticum]